MLDKKDLNQYNTSAPQAPSQRTEGELSQSAAATAKTMGGMVWKAVKTVLCVLFVSGLLVFLSVAAFLLSFRDVEPPDLSAMSLSYSSFVYLDDAEGNSTEYMTIYRDANREWVSLGDIPTYMKTAQIAIEDHRFSEHKGVDWWNTGGAVVKLFTGGSGGGSTLTQQLIKNITKENQVSILRKVKEIFTALNMEKKYSKQQILEAYLNVVNYGGQNEGVEAAAKAYFGKSIAECSLAQCALIAGITQNPAQYNPMVFPEEAKERAYTVLDRMWKLSDGDEDNDELTRYLRSPGGADRPYHRGGVQPGLRRAGDHDLRRRLRREHRERGRAAGHLQVELVYRHHVLGDRGRFDGEVRLLQRRRHQHDLQLRPGDPLRHELPDPERPGADVPLRGLYARGREHRGGPLRDGPLFRPGDRRGGQPL